MWAEEGSRTRHLEVQTGTERSGAARPEPIRDHDSLEAPLPLQHINEEVSVLAAELSAQLVVGRHHHGDVGIPDRRLEGWQVDLAQRPLVDLDVDRHSLEFLIVAHEMLDGATHTLTLHALDIGDRHSTAEEGVL